MMESSTILVIARRIPIRICFFGSAFYRRGAHDKFPAFTDASRSQTSSSSVPELRTTLEIGQKRCRSAFTFSRSERHFDFLEQLCAAAVESRLSVDRHSFELDAVLFAHFVTDDVGAGEQCRHHRFGRRLAHVRAFTLLGFADDCPGTAISVREWVGQLP